MEIHEIRDGDDVLVLAPDGSITDGEETSALEDKLRTALKSVARLVVFDCAAAGHLTSSALRALLLASRKLDRTEGRLVLCGMDARLAKAFSISGFDKDVTVVATRDEALRRVREPIGPRPARKEGRKASKRKDAVPAPQEAAAPEPVAPVEPVVAAMPEPQAVLIEPPIPPAEEMPSVNAHDAMVDVLLDTLGMRVGRVAVARSSGATAAHLDLLANGLLAALRPGRP